MAAPVLVQTAALTSCSTLAVTEPSRNRRTTPSPRVYAVMAYDAAHHREQVRAPVGQQQRRPFFGAVDEVDVEGSKGLGHGRDSWVRQSTLAMLLACGSAPGADAPGYQRPPLRG